MRVKWRTPEEQLWHGTRETTAQSLQLQGPLAWVSALAWPIPQLQQEIKSILHKTALCLGKPVTGSPQTSCLPTAKSTRTTGLFSRFVTFWTEMSGAEKAAASPVTFCIANACTVSTPQQYLTALPLNWWHSLTFQTLFLEDRNRDSLVVTCRRIFFE